MLPSEAIERILSFCDGKTLYNARHVNDNWSELVDYLTLVMGQLQMVISF